MARIRPLASEEFDQQIQDFLGAEIMNDPEKLGHKRIFAHRPSLLIAVLTFYQAMEANSILEPRLVELVRLRIAFHNQCRMCMAHRFSSGVEDGVTEELVCELATPEEAPNMTERERVAVRYGDLLASNHLAIDDAMFAELKRHFTEPEIVELGAYCAFFVGFGRLGVSWDMIEDLPERFQESNSIITPWGGDAVRI